MDLRIFVMVATVGRATLAEYAEHFVALTQLRVSVSTMHRMLRRLEAGHRGPSLGGGYNHVHR